MGQATHDSSNFAHWSTAVAAALIFALVAIPALGEDPSATPGGSDGHLTGLSKDELTALLERYKAEQKFSADSVACFRGFISERKSGLDKEAGKRTATEQSAVKVHGPKEMRAWVSDCLERKGWKNVVEAASADPFGKVELADPVAPPVGNVGKAWTVEDAWISVVHEGSHVASRVDDAKQLGLDFEKWQQWGAIEEKIDAMIGETTLSTGQGLQAITDLAGFQKTNFGRAYSEGRLSWSRKIGQLVKVYSTV